ncbi:MAG: hypothetical protein M1835_004158 [Candelina submexicana]|nr:MAG: hypothetical protein M1835_004158 [Candelina submexicana]
MGVNVRGIRSINGIGKVGLLVLKLRASQHPNSRHTVMDRDRRLTGFLRGQTDHVEAPPGFELNNPWRVESRII